MGDLIIITGAQGSGKTTKANELAKQYAYRKPFQKAKTNIKIFDYSEYLASDIKKELTIDKSNVILCIQKDQLHEVLNIENRRKFLIIDMDVSN